MPNIAPSLERQFTPTSPSLPFSPCRLSCCPHPFLLSFPSLSSLLFVSLFSRLGLFSRLLSISLSPFSSLSLSSPLSLPLSLFSPPLYPSLTNHLEAMFTARNRTTTHGARRQSQGRSLLLQLPRDRRIEGGGTTRRGRETGRGIEVGWGNRGRRGEGEEQKEE